MQTLPKNVRVKVFSDAVTKREFGPIRFPKVPEKFQNLEGKSFDVLAEDPCGNYFTVTPDGAVLFWDHETDDFHRLANSLAEFVAHCVEPKPVELHPDQVKSAWIDPAFAKSLGMKVPEDGWIKKPSKPK